MLVNIVVY